MKITIPGIGDFHGNGRGPLYSLKYPLVLVPGERISAGSRVVSETAAYIAFTGSPSEPVAVTEITAEIQRLAEVRAAYKREWDDFNPVWSAYCEARARAINEIVGPYPSRREVKLGRRMTRREGRAVALDVGYDPVLVHGNVYHEDVTDGATATREHESAVRDWQARQDAAEQEVDQRMPRPQSPDAPSPSCSAELVARHAGLFGYRGA